MDSVAVATVDLPERAPCGHYNLEATKSGEGILLVMWPRTNGPRSACTEYAKQSLFRAGHPSPLKLLTGYVHGSARECCPPAVLVGLPLVELSSDSYSLDNAAITLASSLRLFSALFG